ncbi:hypothetical protein [Streptomyces sp. NPDC055287]
MAEPPVRRRQMDMVRGELERALAWGASLPVGARRSPQRLLEEEELDPYVRLAESGALRTAGWTALSALARQLDRYLAGAMSPTQTRLTTLLALELDTAARSGELVELRTTDLGEDIRDNHHICTRVNSLCREPDRRAAHAVEAGAQSVVLHRLRTPI